MSCSLFRQLWNVACLTDPSMHSRPRMANYSNLPMSIPINNSSHMDAQSSVSAREIHTWRDVNVAHQPKRWKLGAAISRVLWELSFPSIAHIEELRIPSSMGHWPWSSSLTTGQPRVFKKLKHWILAQSKQGFVFCFLLHIWPQNINYD